MKSLLVLAALVALCLAGPATAAPIVEVAFIDPDRYTDASPHGYVINQRERDATLTSLREHLQSRAAQFLKDGDRLRIEVLDVDLAGELELWRARDPNVRILRDSTVPRVRLRYTLSRAGLESSGEERLVDLNYLRESSNCRTGEPLCREKRMLDEWFFRRFADDPRRGSG